MFLILTKTPQNGASSSASLRSNSNSTLNGFASTHIPEFFPATTAASTTANAAAINASSADEFSSPVHRCPSVSTCGASVGASVSPPLDHETKKPTIFEQQQQQQLLPQLQQLPSHLLSGRKSVSWSRPFSLSKVYIYL